MAMIKCTLVGDTRVGKTMLINALLGLRSKKPEKTLVDNYTTDLPLKNDTARLSIWDAGGEASNKRLRSLAYQQSDVFILCYAVNNPESFKNVAMWCDEIERYAAPVILCGMKCDEGSAVSEGAAEKLCKKYQLSGHVSCSAMHKLNVTAVFEKAVSAVGKPWTPRRKTKCCL